MTDPIVSNSPRPPVELTAAEWSEILDCASAFHTCFNKCQGLEGDEAIELTRSVYIRFSRAVSGTNARLENE